MSAELPRYQIVLWGGRWYVVDGYRGTRYGPFESRQNAHDLVVEINTILAEGEEGIRRLLQEAQEG